MSLTIHYSYAFFLTTLYEQFSQFEDGEVLNALHLYVSTDTESTISQMANILCGVHI